jgi:hypothetical protein
MKMFKSIAPFFRTVLCAAVCALFATTTTQAVTIYLELETEGEPIPEATISFETVDGEEIDLEGLFEEVALEEGDAGPVEEPETTENEDEKTEATEDTVSQTDPAELATDESGALSSELPEDLIGSYIFVVVKKDGKIINRVPIDVAKQNPLYLEAYDPSAALVHFTFDQNQRCTAGKTCPLVVKLSNDGTSIYEGPLFFETAISANWSKAATSHGDFFCANAGRGKSLCVIDASVSPGGSQTWKMKLPLARSVSKTPKSCLSLIDIYKQTSGRSVPLVRLLQLGLLQQGFNVGRPDGIAGPRTNAAIASHWEKTGTNDNLSDKAAAHEALFQSLFGFSLQRFILLGVSEDSFCQAMDILPIKKKTQKTTAKSKSQSSQKPNKNDKLLKDALKFGIGIGVMHLLKKDKSHGLVEPLE